MEEERKSKHDTFAVEQEQENDDEDEKIEKFIAIIRRLRDARKYSTHGLRVQEARKLAKNAKIQTSGTLKFQPEDFEEPGLESTHITQPSSSNKECGKEKKEESDLNLTLY